MQYIRHIITRHTWFVCLSVLGVALASDQLMGGTLTLGVVLVCVLRIAAFALDTMNDSNAGE